MQSEEKVKALKTLRNEVFTSCVLQVYAVRVANMVSVITLSQTGKRYYKNQRSLKEGSQGQVEEAKEEGEMQSLLKQTLGNARG